MTTPHKHSFWVMGLALFAMFFGSGNLIFPLAVGQAAGVDWLYASIGFVCTGVLLPFAGVLAMVLYKGNYHDFFAATLGKHLGVLFGFALITVWIPLGSGPRCITMAYAAIAASSPWVPPLWLFSLLYSAIIYAVVSRRSGIFDILGKFLTPILLLCLGTIVIDGLMEPSSPIGPTLPHPGSSEAFTAGLTEGYNTMDLIASFFFSASTIHLLRKDKEPQRILPLLVKSGILGITLLSIVYLGLVAVAAMHGPELASVPKDQALIHLAYRFLGPNLTVVAVAAVSLACVTTSVALMMVYSDYLSETLPFSKPDPRSPLFIGMALSFAMSLTGLEGITQVTSPMLAVFYPILLVLILIASIRNGRSWATTLHTDNDDIDFDRSK